MNRITINKETDKILLFLFFAFLSLNATAQNDRKPITIQNKNISLQEAFTEIEQQTGYSIAYELSAVDVKRKISLSLESQSIDKALAQILKDTRYSYKITGYHIIITPSGNELQKSTKEKTEKPTQTVRGIVLDSKTNAPIEFATVRIMNVGSLGSTTDSLGRFRIDNVPVGRYNIQTSYVGYNTNIFNEIPVTSSKEVYMEITLDENIHSLAEVVIQPEIKKDKPLNAMAITGGRMISMEEAGRFANGFDDPARLSSAFAGVAGDVGTNAVAIRGNSPQFTQWRLEGVEIPNPTHFADLTGLGGGFLSALSTQVIGNSDFYNGAFPSEYSNALSGIFDMQIRNGNNQKYEHTFQLGILGIDLASEGPISRKHGSSYIFNYRFSTTSLATGNDMNLKYQDLSFKLNFPTRKAGTFSIWGIGLIDRYKPEAIDRDEWETQGDRQSGNTAFDKAAGGLTHKYLINADTYIRSSLAATYSKDRTRADQMTEDDKLVHVGDIRNSKWDIVFNSYLNKKFNSNHINRTGITVTGLQYDLDYKISPNFGLDVPMEQISKGNGGSCVLSAYSSSVINLSNHLTTSLGITAQYFTLNKNWTVEPRAALKWSFNPKHALALAYGLHSRREKLDYYFVEQEANGKTESNRYLDFSKAHHFGLTYDWNINSYMHLKVEPYYQYLFRIPVEENSSFSIINHQSFYLDRILKNRGSGVNYGIDITLEQYMKNGFYYMITASLFKSKYKAGDNIWRNTRLDKNYLLNILAGKEWMVGRNKQNVLSLNGRIFFQGGDRYTPVDEGKSMIEHDIKFDETRAYSKKFDPSINGDISFSYRINKKKISHEFSIKMLNVGMRTGMHFYQYNEKTHKIEKKDGSGLIPNISYKIYF
ncbi:carboxypeptidase-like regulatory domain-containing protein [Bacteroides cellulosilyticus]|uniref:carboxypeptidase regulatory-like domain-containing protein n=1 Tax=Bacteroides cellulosilyticus TaxID=246787 RepID=UPI00234C1A0C|nr:carboxypeptidase regulatory-like domain-containing protein [Bacteroides cellulosilyticus]MDC7178783.1 carboxypeptidase-like regulatory domain-containing protein [Bacteroides cellulosilyticus]MDC7179708.1 carboxypeptidase-like regulatory domain-containing protein [Bacteroides cellulosilyticus]